MNQPLRAKKDPQPSNVSAILSDQVMIPITCDHCRHDTEVSLQQLKQQQPILCEHCYEVHQFSDSELALTKMLLAQAGYHFAL